MDTMIVITKLAARAVCNLTDCEVCREIFGCGDDCPYSLEVPDSDCIKLVDNVIQRLREKFKVSPVTEEDLVDILSEEL